MDDTDGAPPAANVLSGKTFWGLTNGEWGLQTGSITTNGSVNGADGEKTFNIPDGYYSGETATCNDTQLTAENIKENIDILGITGSFTGGCTCSGTMNGTRWCDNGDGTVTDMLRWGTTGQCLVWLQDAGCMGSMLWDDSHKPANDLRDNAPGGDCGLSDGSQLGVWRMPTLSEIRALANGTEAVRSSDMRAFKNVVAGGYWGSTAYMRVFLTNGSYYYADEDDSYYVWPVRAANP